MLKNQNPVTMWVPEATRDTFKQIGQATGRPQHEVVAEAAELLRKREERRAKRNS
jgi:hypothetical protein